MEAEAKGSRLFEDIWLSLFEQCRDSDYLAVEWLRVQNVAKLGTVAQFMLIVYCLQGV